MLIEKLHAVLLTGLNDGGDLMDLALPNQIRDGGRAHHDLPGGETGLAVLGAQQDLSDHPFE